MPPRTTQQSHRPRVSDRTMVGTSPPRSLQALRHGTKNAATDGPGSGATQRSRTEPHTGLDVGQLPLPAEREKYFLLTSPFIEPPPSCLHLPQQLVEAGHHRFRALVANQGTDLDLRQHRFLQPFAIEEIALHPDWTFFFAFAHLARAAF